MLAVATEDRIGLWDLTTQRPLAQLAEAATEALAFSPTEGLLAVGSSGAAGQPGLDLWDVQARTVTKTLKHEAEVRSVAFSPDGKLLATFDDRGNIAVKELASDQVLTRFTAPPPRRRPCGVVAFSPDGSRLAIGEDYGRIRLLNWRTGAEVPIETHTSEGVAALSFSPTAELFAAGFSDPTGGLIRLWDSASGAPRGQFTNHTGYVNALAFAPDGGLLASAGGGETIRVWSLVDQTERCVLRGHVAEVLALVFLPDSRTLVSGGQDCSVRFWDVTPRSRPSGHTNLAVASRFDARSGMKAAGAARGAPEPETVPRLGVAFMPNSRSLITTEPDGTLGIWDAQSAQQVERLPLLGTNYWGVALSPDGRWLATGHASGKVLIWDWRARRRVVSLDVSPFEWFGTLRFSRSGRFLLARIVPNDHRTYRLRIWRIDGWSELSLVGIQAQGLQSADLSRDDCLLAVGYGDGLRLWRFPSGQLEAVLSTQGTVEVRFSPDGRTLASTSGDYSVGLWDVFTRQPLATFRGHLSWVWSATFSADGRRLATGGTTARDAVKLWDTAAHRELLTLHGDGQYFFDVTFSPDGSTLVATSLDGMAHFWRAPSWAEIKDREQKGH